MLPATIVVSYTAAREREQFRPTQYSKQPSSPTSSFRVLRFPMSSPSFAWWSLFCQTPSARRIPRSREQLRSCSYYLATCNGARKCSTYVLRERERERERERTPQTAPMLTRVYSCAGAMEGGIQRWCQGYSRLDRIQPAIHPLGLGTVQVCHHLESARDWQIGRPLRDSLSREGVENTGQR